MKRDDLSERFEKYGTPSEATVLSAVTRIGTSTSGAPSVNYDEIDSGVRQLVRYLRERGFDTCDSGDGSKAGTMGCARTEPHVTVRADSIHLISVALRLRDAADDFGLAVSPIGMGDWSVQATFDPCDRSSFVDLFREPQALGVDGGASGDARD